MMGVSGSPDTSLKPEIKDKGQMVSGTFSALQGALPQLELMTFLLDNQFKHLWLIDDVYIQICVYIFICVALTKSHHEL